MAIPTLTKPTNNLDISSATFLGGAGQDSANAVDISLTGGVTILGGELPQYRNQGKQIDLLGGGNGTVVRYASGTQKILSVTRLPGEVKDLEVNPKTGQIAIAGDFGVAVLNPAASQVIWRDNSAAAERVAVSAGGRVAAVQGSGKIQLYSNQGKVTKTFSTGKGSRRFNDVAITDQRGGTVIATGYEQKLSNLQVAFTQAWSYGGSERWRNYDFSASAAQKANLMADTRGERVAIGRDGKLYMASSINGGTGASIFARDPLNIAQSAASETVQTDRYNTPTNVGSVKMTWYGRYDLASGDLVKGQSLLTRLTSGKGNSIVPKSIMADEQGTVYLAGQASARTANRDNQTIEGRKVSGYAGSEGFLTVLSPDLKERYVWTPFTQGESNAVNVRGKVAAVAISADADASLVTLNAVQNKSGGGQDAYLLVIGAEAGGGNPKPKPTPAPAPKPTPKPSGSDSNSVITGTNRNDRLLGNAQDQTLKGFAGKDIIRAGAGRDRAYGGNGMDTLFGAQGNDRLFGQKGNDRVHGGVGNDRLQGNQGNDKLYGNEGNDDLKGGFGNDLVNGGSGRDRLLGAAAQAGLPGRHERDVFIGGGHADTFVLGDSSKVYYNDARANTLGLKGYAVLQDFSRAQGDKIQLHGQAKDYRLGASPRGVTAGKGLFLKTPGQDELIAVVQNNPNLNLQSSAFNFV